VKTTPEPSDVSRLGHENHYLRKLVCNEAGQAVIVGESEPVKRVLHLITKGAPTDSAVLILGETGTGKELLANAVHHCSARREQTMVKLNCAALPSTLIESELFGRDKGAYTGAMTQRPGRFEIANGSTLFLDEIGEMPLDIQAKFLRVLETGEFERLGSNRSIRADVRIVAASNRDLLKQVQEGKFREDLYHRLNVFPVTATPLRERRSDVPLLAWHFIKIFNTKMGRSVDTVPKSVMEKLKAYPWPGNIRELKNVIERAMILCDHNSLDIELNPMASDPMSAPVTLEELECSHIRATLDKTGWRISGKTGAAERLGILPTTLHSRMKKLGIHRPE
jgi:transcriptional regulator with GAF, ATPase, and Fis domain